MTFARRQGTSTAGGAVPPEMPLVPSPILPSAYAENSFGGPAKRGPAVAPSEGGQGEGKIMK
jgi:hypothetical protein